MKKLKTKFSMIFSLTTLFCLQNLSAQTVTNTKKNDNKSIDSLIEKKINEAEIVGMGAAITK